MQLSTWNKTSCFCAIGAISLHRIDDAVRIGHGRRDDQRGDGRDRLFDLLGDGAEGLGIDRHQHLLEPEIVGALVEGGMGGDRQHDLGRRDLLGGARPIPRGLDGQHAAFGAATGEIADHIFVAALHGGRDRDQLALHAREAGIDGGIERVLSEVLHIGALGDALDVRPAVIDIGQRLAFAPRHVAISEMGELVEQFVFGKALGRHFVHGHVPARSR